MLDIFRRCQRIERPPDWFADNGCGPPGLLDKGQGQKSPQRPTPMNVPMNDLVSPVSGTAPQELVAPIPPVESSALPLKLDRTRDLVPRSDAPKVDPVLGKVNGLSDAEQAELYACEAVIETGWATFVQVGLALARIREAQLYRLEFQRFDTYCRVKWQYARRYVDQVIAAAQLFNYLSANCARRKPDHESQLRPLVGLSLEQAAAAWERAASRAGPRKITALMVKTALKELGFGSARAPTDSPPRQNRKEQRQLIDAAIGELLLLLSQKAGHDTLTLKVEALHRQIRSILHA
jgi:hypothetical protein